MATYVVPARLAGGGEYLSSISGFSHSCKYGKKCYNSDMIYHDKNKAFTLAEVLITLGIIGVVAAMTIPTLVTSYKKNVIETRLAGFYSKINQAIKASEVHNGEKEAWDIIPNAGYETGEDGKPDLSKPSSLRWFDKYLRPYLKVTKVVADKKSGFTVVYLPDGSCFRLAINSVLSSGKGFWRLKS